MCNPIYDKSDLFIDVLKKAYERDRSTRALLIVPVRKGDWFTKLTRDEDFRLLALYFAGAELFTHSSPSDPLASARGRLLKTREPIAMWEMNSDPTDLELPTYIDMPKASEDMVGWTALRD